MKSKMIAEAAGQKTFLLVLAPGEEAFSAITDFAKAEKIGAASLTALGAFERTTVAWFDLATQDYVKIPITEQVEVLSLIGDIAIDDEGKPSLHAHVVLGLRDGTTRGGHLMEAIVRPTLEVTVIEAPSHLRRKKRPELGLALIDPGA
ncbi:PPC domain-containing DNA-binding protein [Roseococcus pinisoli]|uniref:DNA-binding protein n=1 Tax=Roseococcus pinisoli TaxID=2835040 RepID=A0ABS5QG65_9PROT|nr:PPC domain-containing DNA-binding protein [Roseococcus pinisoli]MBS7811912.1 DNA-binding protein [Roseococcus pinisoli]